MAILDMPDNLWGEFVNIEVNKRAKRNLPIANMPRKASRDMIGLRGALPYKGGQFIL